MLTLVSPALSYVEEIQRCASDPRVSATSNIPDPYPPDGARKWVDRILISTQEKKSTVFLVLNEGIFCGVMSLNRIDWNGGSAELDYWIAAEPQSKGVGSMAARLTIDRAQGELKLNVLFSACLSDNPASVRVLEKNGFHETKRFLNDGAFGMKFLNREMRRFRKNISPRGWNIRDGYVV